MGIVLALGSSAILGFSDFAGAVLVRRFGLISVLVVSHVAGLATVGAFVAAQSIELRAVEGGLLAGASYAIAVASFYRALDLGTVSVVSPLLSCGGLVAFMIAIAAGERPSGLATTGAVAVVLGAVLVSTGEHSTGGQRRTAIWFAVAAAVANGSYLYILGAAADEGGGPSAVFGARLSSAVLILGAVVVLCPKLAFPAQTVRLSSAYGCVAALASILLGLAYGHGLIAIIAVLGSLYPAVTILLSRAFLGERLSNTQKLGVPVVLVGVSLVVRG